MILLEGARQVGKTTLAEHVLKDSDIPCISLNLERQSLIRGKIDETREFAEFEELLTDEMGLDTGTESVLFIDEAQESRKLGGYVRFMKESWPATRVVLSGSTLIRIFRGDVRYPVGRVRRLILRPFTFTEFLVATQHQPLADVILETPLEITAARHTRLLKQLDEYLQVGGLPEIVLLHAAGGDFAHRRAEILADYEQDFIRLFGEERIAIVKGCLRSVANFVGTPSKNTTVIPQPTSRIHEEIRRIFGRLEAWHLVIHSEQRGPSPEASHRYHPKRYLFDTGVLRGLREKAVPSISILHTLSAAERRPLGGIVENQVAIELAGRQEPLAGWKKSSAGVEIDFVPKIGEQVVPVECKAALQAKRTHLRGLFAYLRFYEQRTGVFVSFAPYEEINGPGGAKIVNVPLYLAEVLERLLPQ